jgi:hypothetical protein
MSDVVFDTTVVAFANSGIAPTKARNSFRRRLGLLDAAACRRVRVRYNGRLLHEYQQAIKEFRNDVIQAFFAILDSPAAIWVPKSTLSRQLHIRATQSGWPTHDRHLLAAAINGDNPRLYVTEKHLANCGSRIYRILRVRVHLV